METLTTRIVNYCKNNDTYNFKDNVTDLKDFTSNVNNLLIFAPGDIITYLKSNIDCGIEEKRELRKLINDINDISYQDLTMLLLDSLKSYSLSDIDIFFNEFLSKRMYKHFLCLSLAYMIQKTLHVESDINIKNNMVLSGFIATQFNNIKIASLNNKSILEILDNLDFKYNFNKLTTIVNNIREDLRI